MGKRALCQKPTALTTLSPMKRWDEDCRGAKRRPAQLEGNLNRSPCLSLRSYCPAPPAHPTTHSPPSLCTLPRSSQHGGATGVLIQFLLITIVSDFWEVRRSEEQSDDLITQSQAAKTTRVRAFVQDAPLPNHHNNPHASSQPYSQFASLIHRSGATIV